MLLKIKSQNVIELCHAGDLNSFKLGPLVMDVVAAVKKLQVSIVNIL